MAQCSRCRHRFRTLEDEEGMHDCPRCGWDGRPCQYCGSYRCEGDCPERDEAEAEEPDNSDELENE